MKNWLKNYAIDFPHVKDVGFIIVGLCVWAAWQSNFESADIKAAPLSGLYCAEAPAKAESPFLTPPSLSLPATIVSVKDGDTLRVRVTLEMPVRLKSCWAPELNEKGGTASRNHLRELCPDSELVMVQIPFFEDISQMLSLGRVVGDIVLKDGRSVAKTQVETGHASSSKPR